MRQRCEEVFRNATGHPSFMGRGGEDLRDVFAGLICAAYAGRLAASEQELQAIRETVGDTEFALRQQVARLREALQGLYDEQKDAPLETRKKQWQAAMNLASEALRETGA